MKALDELIKARSLLVLDHCFWGMLAMKLKFIEGEIPEWLPQTMATEGTEIRFVPDFVEKLTTPEAIGVLAHEVMHCAMGDLWRLDGRDPTIWNIACDFVNNEILVNAGFTLPKGALLDKQFNGKSKEEVYTIIYKKCGGGKNGKGKQSGGSQGPGKGQPDDGNGKPQQDKCGGMFEPADKKQNKQQQIEWKKAVAAAAQLSKGDLPADLRRLIMDEVVDPPLPWHVLLRDFVEKTARNDYNWSRASKRYLHRGIVLPSLISEELPMVAVVGDTSGSTQEHQAKFAAETSAILGSFNTTILFIQCDARNQLIEEYKTEDLPIKFTMHGGGGTDFRPPFKHIAKEGLSPACLIYLTDMEGTFPSEAPEYPVLWVSTQKNQKAPFGTVIEMTDY